MTVDSSELIVSNLAAWRRWLAKRPSDSEGVWLVLAKKGTTRPTSLTYDQALEEALCHGWVDGQLARRDEGTFRRRFTPRRTGGAWSKRNIAIIERLTAEGRMRPAGLRAVERAKADGTWDAAYGGAATIEVPDDLRRAHLLRNLGPREPLPGSTRRIATPSSTGSQPPGVPTPAHGESSN